MGNKIKATPQVIEYIRQMIESVDYGRVIIDIQDHLKTLDITVEQKTRFEKKSPI